jgi:hypothetical protein
MATPWNIVPADPYGAVKESLDKIDNNNETPITGAAEGRGAADDAEPRTLDDILTAESRPSPTDGAMDLIGHSKNGVLGVASWDVGVFAGTEDSLKSKIAAWGPILAESGIRDVRLLGCGTAAHIASSGPSLEFAVTLNRDLPSEKSIAVWGSTVPLFSAYFNGDGFKQEAEDGSLTTIFDRRRTMRSIRKFNFWNAKVPSLADFAIKKGWFCTYRKLGDDSTNPLRLLKAEASSSIVRELSKVSHRMRWPITIGEGPIDTLTSTFLGPAAQAPGLLAIPDAEIVFPVASTVNTNTFHRVTLLFGGAHVRVYPSGYSSGIIFEVRNRPDRERLLNLVKSGKPL